jgi:methyl-accepting chemotaxis protein
MKVISKIFNQRQAAETTEHRRPDIQGTSYMPMFISAVKNWKHRPHPSLTDWQNRLDAACGILHELAAGTEGEFIRLGEKLQDFYFRAKTLSDLSSQVAGCLSGEALQQGVDGLQTVFTQVQQQDELSGKGISVLSSLLNRFDNIDARMKRFDQTIRNLDVLCNFIKIESARLGSKDTGFSALGDEVRKLAVNVAAKSAELTGHSEKLAETIRQGLQRMKDFKKRQQGNARTILDQTVQSLSAMNLRRQSSSETLSETAVRWKRMSQSIGEVVSSMQFHDITRQRIEHVRDALQDVRGKLRSAAPAASEPGNGVAGRWRHLLRPRPRKDLATLSSAIIPCEVQNIQLKDAESDMTAAVERIIRNLTQIGKDIGVMTGDLQTLTTAGGSEASFLSELEKQLASLGNAITAYRAINREWAASVEAITTSIGDMSIFIHDIEKIGIQMRMIALNACIHAAHIGQEGAALGTLAESIRQLSDETSQKIEEISESLKAIVTEAGTFAKISETGGSAASAGQPARTDLIARTESAGRESGQIETLIAPLHQMDQEVSGLLTRIGQDGGSLTQDIEVTVQHIDIHHKISAKIHEVTAALEGIVTEVKQLCPATVSETAPGVTTEMAGRYTMEREREIHQSIAGAALAAATVGGVDTASEPTSAENSTEPEIFSDILFDDEKSVESTDDILFDENLTTLDSDTAPFAEVPVSTAADAPPDTAPPEDDLGDNIELF